MKGFIPWIIEVLFGTRPPKCSGNYCNGRTDPRCGGGLCPGCCYRIHEKGGSGEYNCRREISIQETAKLLEACRK